MVESASQTHAKGSARQRPPVDFVDLLLASRGYLQQTLHGQMPDPLDAQTQEEFSGEQLFAYVLMRGSAERIRSELFTQGRKRGLSEREVVIALLKPMAHLLRPAIAPEGCTCRSCRSDSASYGSGGAV